jgi:hypothetical protein
MTRRFWLRALASLGGCWALVGIGQTARADQQQANLKETLRTVLRCRRDEEFEFADLVALKVEQGQLPLDMVLSMLKWARKRRPELPFPYFKEGIKQRAASIGVNL